MHMPIVCQNPACGQTFLVHPYRSTTARYCSRACQGIAPRPRRKRGLELACQWPGCGKPFYRKPDKVRRKKRIDSYCSQKCRRLGGTIFLCENPGCGKTFYMSPSDIKKDRGKKRGKHCSFECMKQHYDLEHARYGSTRQEANNAKARERYAVHPEKGRDAARKRKALKAGAPKIELVSLDVLFLRDKGICSLCHKKVPRAEATNDHVIPLSLGGNHTYQNCALAHRSCNASKQNRAVTQQQRLF